MIATHRRGPRGRRLLLVGALGVAASVAAGCGEASDSVPDGGRVATDATRSPAVSVPPRQSTTTASTTTSSTAPGATASDSTASTAPGGTGTTTGGGVSPPPTSGGSGPTPTTETTLIPNGPPPTQGGGGVTTPPTQAVGTAALRDVRAARNDPGFDRVVFEFGASGPASYSVEYVSKPVTTDGGAALNINGDNVLRVRMTSASAASYGGPDRINPTTAYNTQLVVEMVKAGDADGQVTWMIGVRGRPAYSVVNLPGPNRVIIDIR